MGNKDKTDELNQDLQELFKDVRRFKPKVKANNSKQGRKKEVENPKQVPTDAVTSQVEKMQV